MSIRSTRTARRIVQAMKTSCNDKHHSGNGRAVVAQRTVQDAAKLLMNGAGPRETRRLAPYASMK